MTSPNPEDGRTTVVMNLAIVMAQAGRRVLLLDGPHADEIAFVRNRSMTGVRFWWRPARP